MEERGQRGSRHHRVRTPSPPCKHRRYCTSSNSGFGRLDSIGTKNYRGLPDSTLKLGPAFTIAVVGTDNVARSVTILETAVNHKPASRHDFDPNSEDVPSSTFNFITACYGSDGGPHKRRQSLVYKCSRNFQPRLYFTDAHGKYVHIANAQFDSVVMDYGILYTKYTQFEEIFDLITGGKRYTLIDESLMLPEALSTSIKSLQAQKMPYLTKCWRLGTDLLNTLASYPPDLRMIFGRLCWQLSLHCSQMIADNEAERRRVIQLKESLTSLWRVVAHAANKSVDGAGTIDEGPEIQDYQADLNRVLNEVQQSQSRLRDLLQQLWSLEDERGQANYDDLDHQMRFANRSFTTAMDQWQASSGGPPREAERQLQADQGEVSPELLRLLAKPVPAKLLTALQATALQCAREKHRLDRIAKLPGQITKLRQDISNEQSRLSDFMVRQTELEAVRNRANQAQGTQHSRGAPVVQVPGSSLRLQQKTLAAQIQQCDVELKLIDEIIIRRRARRNVYRRVHRHAHGDDGIPEERISRELEVEIGNTKTRLKVWLKLNPQEGGQRLDELLEKYLRKMEEVQLYNAAIGREEDAYNKRWDRAKQQLTTEYARISASFGLIGGSIVVDRNRKTIALNSGHFAEGAGAEGDADRIGRLAFGIACMSIQSAMQPRMAFVLSASNLRYEPATWAKFLRQLGLVLRQSERNGVLYVSEPVPDDLLNENVTQRDLRPPTD